MAKQVEKLNVDASKSSKVVAVIQAAAVDQQRKPVGVTWDWGFLICMHV